MEIPKVMIKNFEQSISQDFADMAKATGNIGNPDYDPNDTSTQDPQQSS